MKLYAHEKKLTRSPRIHLQLHFLLTLGAALLWSGALKAQGEGISYDFKTGIPSEVSVHNAPALLVDDTLKIEIDDTRKVWSTTLVISVNKPLPENPMLRLKYRVGTPSEIATSTLATTLQIDGIHTSGKDKGTWRTYTGVDISKSGWKYHDIELQPLISGWEQNHGADHGNIEEIKVVIGTGGAPFEADALILDSIKIGNILSIKRVDLNPENLKEIIVYLGSPAIGSPEAANFSVTYQGRNLPVKKVFLRNEDRVVVELKDEVGIPDNPKHMPSLALDYGGNDEIKDHKGVALWPFSEEVSLSGILGDYIDINPNGDLGNPLHLTFFGPDPSAHVWDDGRIYVYPSRDTPDQRDYMGMQSWHVISSDDLVNWTDHGRIFHVDDIPWVKEKAWAPDCAYKNGTYYFYFPVNDMNGEHWVGVATSKSPTGPFENPEKICRSVDPQVFEDYDGNFWMALNNSIQKLSDDMLSVVGRQHQYHEYAVGFPYYKGWAHEGTWVFKRNGLYYLTLAGKSAEPLPEGMAEGMPILYYGMSTSPTGPFEFKGMIMDAVGNPHNPNYLANNHHSVVKIKGRWVLFYHKMWKAPDGAVQRAMCADYINFNPDGTIQLVTPTDTGVDLRNHPALEELEGITIEETIRKNEQGVEASFRYAGHDIIDPDYVVWDFGDGTTQTDRFEEGVSRTYTDKGVYTVTMSVWLDGAEKRIVKKNLISVD